MTGRYQNIKGDLMKKKNQFIISTVMMVLSWSMPLYAEDSQVSRGTLAGLPRIYVLVENIQPNIQKYSQNAGLTTTQLQRDIEKSLTAAGIRTMTRDEWLKALGRPVLYLNINTHETEKYWYAYDIKLELRQIVHLEANPKVKTLADTWSINITGMANIGNLNVVTKDTSILLDRFIQAYRSANKRK
jgi:hypothetical protein